jgi:phage shock protein E
MKKLNFLPLFFLFFVINACLQAQQATTNLQPQEFINKLKATKDAQLLDVRTPDEWANGKIQSSECINFMAEDFKQKVEKLDKNKPVFVYCAAGGRSTKASKILQEAGFKQVFNLQGGGFSDLSKAGVK